MQEMESLRPQTWTAENMTANTGEAVDGSLLASFLPSFVKILFFVCVYLIANVVFLLSSQRLVSVYLLAGSLGVVVASYQLNMSVVHHMISSAAEGQGHNRTLLQLLLSLDIQAMWEMGESGLHLLANYLVQGLLGFLFTAMSQGPHSPSLHRLLITSFLLPSCCLLVPLPAGVQESIPVFTALFPLVLVKYTISTNLLHCFSIIYGGIQYARIVMRNFGLHSLMESEWVRLNVPNVLRTFWLLRVAQHLASLLGEYMYVHGEYQSLLSMDMSAMYMILKAVMTQGCETVVALLGMTSIISYAAHYVDVLFQFVLLTEEDDDRSMGTVCAILFFILAEQSGLTILDSEKRFIRLCRNFCLLFTAVLHFIHNMVNPVLMSLSASRNPALYRHLRALGVCACLIVCPAFTLIVLWSLYPISTWLLAVSAFSIQVIVKTLVSLLIYTLFLIDAFQITFWEKLDDYVYYIRAFGNSVEFVFGILLFFNGAWIYIFESGGSIRAFMMCIHAYFNIWCEAKNGWSVFMKRRTAVNKINSLPEATREELEKHDDVCAICFQDLQTAKITTCKHFFHSVCLRKWLYVQDSCPLCHETLYKTDTHQPKRQHDVPEDDNQHEEDTAEREMEEGGVAANDVVLGDEGVERPGMNDVDREDQEQHGASSREGDIPGGRVEEAVVRDDLEMRVNEEPGDMVVVDDEVGEALLQHPHMEDNMAPPVQDVGVHREEDGGPIVSLRCRRNQLIDQDIGQLS
ncbi:protein TRC8 homolog isoform X2 [Oratosquilla oratoria]